jgi:opacity protein-like surface antigen
MAGKYNGNLKELGRELWQTETQQLRVERRTTRSTQHFTGFRMGVGVEFSISDNNIIRAGYDHTMTSDISFAGARVRPSRDTYRIGLVRRF